jgi:hypothetical protein
MIMKKRLLYQKEEKTWTLQRSMRFQAHDERGGDQGVRNLIHGN